VDWRSSRLVEGLNDFHARAIKNVNADEEPNVGSPIPWALSEQDHFGHIRFARRNAGTVQKDWAVVRSNALGSHLSIAVRGHKGWSKDPDSAARYALVVTLEILGQQIRIYELVRNSVNNLAAEIVVENEARVRV
jgi:hypothetical protein